MVFCFVISQHISELTSNNLDVRKQMQWVQDLGHWSKNQPRYNQSFDDSFIFIYTLWNRKENNKISYYINYVWGKGENTKPTQRFLIALTFQKLSSSEFFAQIFKSKQKNINVQIWSNYIHLYWNEIVILKLFQNNPYFRGVNTLSCH